MSQQVVVVSLIVKESGNFPQSHAESHVLNRLNEWLLDPKENVMIEGFGYPDGSLLSYTILNSFEFDEVCIEGVMYRKVEEANA